MNTKKVLIWSAINVATAPLIGTGLAHSGLPSLLCIYIILAVTMAPLAVLAWEYAKDEKSA